MNEQEMQIKLYAQQEKVKALRQEVAEINKERECWNHYRIQAAIAAMQGFIITVEVPIEDIAKKSVKLANALVEELQKKGEQE